MGLRSARDESRALTSEPRNAQPKALQRRLMSNPVFNNCVPVHVAGAPYTYRLQHQATHTIDRNNYLFPCCNHLVMYDARKSENVVEGT
jgi:hypothetical protein